MGCGVILQERVKERKKKKNWEISSNKAEIKSDAALVSR